jgi:hypothetical protein
MDEVVMLWESGKSQKKEVAMNAKVLALYS